MAQMDNATSSDRERRMWGLSLDAWSTLMVWSLAVGALSAAVVGVTTFITIKLQKQEATDAQNDLERYKATVAGQVADAEREGIAAGKAAGDAILRASEADERAANANERAAALEFEAAKLKGELARVKAPLIERRVTQEQRNVLIREFSSTKRVRVGVIAPSSDREINRYALEIIAAIDASDAHVFLRYIAGSIENAGINAVPAGVNIIGDEPALSIVRKAFTEAGIPFGTEPLDVGNLFIIPGSVFISIGERPILSQ
jgi:hypothetical protein